MTKTALETFLETAPPIDDVREDAARVCDETVRYMRGERGPLRTPMEYPPLLAEFSDAAFGTASEVMMAVLDALKQAKALRQRPPYFSFEMAATLLRAGWQRGHILVGQQLLAKADRS